MKYNTLNTIVKDKEVEVKGEVVVILSSKEVDTIIAALGDYTKANPRKKLAKELFDTFYGYVPIIG